MNPDRLAELEEERRFLLASIRDLDRERAVGDVDDNDHRVLRDGYVARAAAVLREIESGRSQLPPSPHRPLWRRAAVPLLTLAAAAGLGVAVAQYSGQRLPGQTITGGPEIDEVTGLLTQARQVLLSDAPGALAAYDRVLELEPDNPEAVTYRAWLLVLGARGAGDAALIEAQLSELQRATTIDPDYADPHCFLAVATGRFIEPPDTEVSRAEAQACLDRNPPAALRPAIEALLLEG